MGLRQAPVSLLAGSATAVATVAVYQWWWGLLLAAGATLLALLALPAGWCTRLPYAAGYVVVVALTSVPRGEGDYLVSSGGPGYAVLGLAVSTVALAVATLPRPGRKILRPAGGSAPRE